MDDTLRSIWTNELWHVLTPHLDTFGMIWLASMAGVHFWLDVWSCLGCLHTMQSYAIESKGSWTKFQPTCLCTVKRNAHQNRNSQLCEMILCWTGPKMLSVLDYLPICCRIGAVEHAGWCTGLDATPWLALIVDWTKVSNQLGHQARMSSCEFCATPSCERSMELPKYTT